MNHLSDILRKGVVVLLCAGGLALSAQTPADTFQLSTLLQEIDSLAGEGHCAALPPLIARAQRAGQRLGGPWLERALAAGGLQSQCFRLAGEYQQALAWARKHLEKVERLSPGSEVLMDAYKELGINLYRMSRYNEARATYEKGLALARRLFGDESIQVARFNNNIGLTLGDERAIPWHERAVRILQLTGDTASMEAVIFHFNLAVAWYNIGELRKSVEGFRNTLRLLEALPDPAPGTIALIKNNLSVALQNLGEREESMRLLLETLDLYEAVFGPDHPQTAYGYSNLGLFLYNEGDYARALNYFFKALAIRRAKMGEQHELVGNLYNNIGNCYRGLKRYQDALDYCEKALAIRLAVLGPNHREVADSYDDLGATYHEMGLYERALQYYQRALEVDGRALGPNHPFLSDAWFHLGSCLLDMGRPREARSAFRESLRILQDNYLPGHPEIARTKGKLALCFPDDPATARRWFDEALDEIGFAAESRNRPDLLLHDPLVLLQILQDKTKWLHDQYRASGDVALLHEALAFFDQAIAVIDQVRMQYREAGSRQALLDRFYETYEGAIDAALTLYDQSADPAWLDRAFALSEKSKSTLLHEAVRETTVLRAAGVPDELLQTEYALEQEITSLEKQRFHEYQKGKNARNAVIDSLDSRIFELKEAYYALRDSMEKHYLAPASLHYTHRAVALEEVQRHLAPTEALVEYFVGKERMVTFCITRDTAWHLLQVLDFPLASWVEELRQSIRNYHPLAADRNYNVQKYTYLANELYARLWQPLESHDLPQRICIIPAGVIANLPFGALLDSLPAQLEYFRDYPYLIRKHRFSYNYSAELMLRLEEGHGPGNHRLAAFAPDFSQMTDSIWQFRPLQHNIEEAAAVARLWGGDLYAGSEATLDRFLAEAPGYGILHLATHGQANDYRGEYSYLVFQPATADTSELAWLLYVRDLYHLNLPAEMVVLSACETSIGEYQRGEGVVSLARGFFYAGARSLITTLWTIDDRASAHLIQRFYELLADGKAKDEALQQACLEAIDAAPSQQKAHPLYWAAFVPLGNMQSLTPSPWWSRSGWLLTLVALLVIATFWWHRTRPGEGVRHEE